MRRWYREEGKLVLCVRSWLLLLHLLLSFSWPSVSSLAPFPPLRRQRWTCQSPFTAFSLAFLSNFIFFSSSSLSLFFSSSSSSLFLYLRGDVGEEEEEKVNESFTCTHVALLALFSFRSASPLLPLNSYLIAPPPSYYYQISRFALIFSFTRESDPEIRKPRVFVTDNKHIPGPTRLFGLLINFFFPFSFSFSFLTKTFQLVFLFTTKIGVTSWYHSSRIESSGWNPLPAIPDQTCQLGKRNVFLSD